MNIIKKEATGYRVFDEVILNNDRLCFYYKFSLEQGITFAAKQQVDSKITSIKDVPLIGIFEWLAFSPLAYKLMESDKFTNRYKQSLKHIIPNKLCILTINSESFYLVLGDDGWHGYQSVNEHPYLQNDETQKAIDKVMGKNFIATQENHLKLEAHIDNNFAQGVSEMRKFKQDMLERKSAKSDNENQELLVVDVNESTSSVTC